MSRSSSLLAGGVDAVGLDSAWSSLPKGYSNSTVVGLASDVLSMLLRAVRSSCAVALHAPHVALL